MNNYSFDSELFKKLFSNQSDNYARLSNKMDVDWRTVQRWTEGSDIQATNIAKVCNLFHINPLSFFPCEGEQAEMAHDAKCHFPIRRNEHREEEEKPKRSEIEAYREARRDLNEEYERRIERMESKIEELQGKREELQEKLAQERMRSKELEVRLEMANQQLRERAEVKMYIPKTPNSNLVSEELNPL